MPDHTAAVNALMDWLQERVKAGALAAVGHRVVHGGPDYWRSQRITPAIIRELHQLSPFDPEHLPEEILLTEAFHRRFPNVPQIACFDTAFHDQGLRIKLCWRHGQIARTEKPYTCRMNRSRRIMGDLRKPTVLVQRGSLGRGQIVSR